MSKMNTLQLEDILDSGTILDKQYYTEFDQVIYNTFKYDDPTFREKSTNMEQIFVKNILDMVVNENFNYITPPEYTEESGDPSTESDKDSKESNNDSSESNQQTVTSN